MILRVKAQATNQMGSTLGEALQFVLAGTPGQPAPAPAADAAGTSTSAIKVVFENQSGTTGGSPILLYEL